MTELHRIAPSLRHMEPTSQPPLPEEPPDERPAGGRGYDGPKVPPRTGMHGDEFIFADGDELKAVWGKDSEVLWASGEPLMVAARQGTGKTTLAQRLTLARVGITTSLLDYPIAPGQRNTLYLALDRPKQISRSFNRMVGPEHAQQLHDRLYVWRGPLPFNALTERGALAQFAETHDADTLIIDSLKDLAPGLSKDEVGGIVNSEIQGVIARGVEVVTLHHHRKATGDNKDPKTIDDIFGSVWLTSGHGSVLFISGQPGDTYVKLLHLKNPDEKVGPLELVHDHATGNIAAPGNINPLDVLRNSRQGVTARGLAEIQSGSADPDRSAVARATRRLDKLVETGHAHKQPGSKGGQGGGTPATYYATDTRHGEAA